MQDFLILMDASLFVNICFVCCLLLLDVVKLRTNLIIYKQEENFFTPASTGIRQGKV